MPKIQKVGHKVRKLSKERVLASKYSFSKLQLAIFVVAFALVGGYVLIRIFAAGVTISVEPELGTVTSPAIKGNDATASGGQYVQFKTAGIPAACNNGGTFLWSNLQTCGWPNSSNTGYPAGTTLTNTSGRTITTNGAVIDGEKITGGLEIAANNVIVRNSWITKYVAAGLAANATGVINVHPGASVTVEHTTLDGQDGTHTCIWHEGISLNVNYVNCFGANDGIFSWTGDNITITDSYIHDLSTVPSNGHVDGFQTEGAQTGILRHNTIDISQNQNSAIAIWNSLKTSNNFTIDNNLVAGGGFAVYAEDYDPSESSPVGGFSTTNINFTSNKFSIIHYGCVGGFGVWYYRPAIPPYFGGPTDGWHRTGNTVLETGENIDNTNPHDNGTLCS